MPILFSMTHIHATGLPEHTIECFLNNDSEDPPGEAEMALEKAR